MTASPASPHPPGLLTVSLVNDYEIIVQGLAAMLAPFADRVTVVELEVDGTPDRCADVALFDTFGGRRHTLERADQMVRERRARHVVLYTWDASAGFLSRARDIGVAGVVWKGRSATELVDALERVARGERCGLDDPFGNRERASASPLSWREQEILALVALGRSNREIADELFLSVDTVKTYLRRLYDKLGVHNRAQAAVVAVTHGIGDPGPCADQHRVTRTGDSAHVGTLGTAGADQMTVTGR